MVYRQRFAYKVFGVTYPTTSNIGLFHDNIVDHRQAGWQAGRQFAFSILV
jgi:hypothetical protein